MKKIILTTLLTIGALTALATPKYDWEAGYQWSATVPTMNVPNEGVAEGYLWIAPETEQLRALIFAFQNMSEEQLFTSPRFREQMADLGVGILWIAPAFGQEWDEKKGVQEAFFGLLSDLAKTSGHQELTTIPLIPFGHSAQATMPWNFAAWNPDRTLCILSYKGDSPRTNLCGYGGANMEWGRTRNIDGIPGLMVMGEYEWWTDRQTPSLSFRMMYPYSCISFFGDAGRGHFDMTERTADYLALFIKKSLEQRVQPDGSLKKLDPKEGWLSQRWKPGQTKRAKPTPYAKYKGDPHEAFWYFDEEMAAIPETRYKETKGKKPCWLGFTDEAGNLLVYNLKGHCKTVMNVTPHANDCFTLHAVFTDSLRLAKDPTIPARPVRFGLACGPAVQVNDSTFRVDRKHPTWDSPRRRGSITLFAETPSTKDYKETVTEIEVRIQD